MNIKYYLLDSLITTADYKQTKEINLADVDKDQFIICQESPFTGVAYSNYGVSEDITKLLYTKTPLSLEAETDNILDTVKFITDLTLVYKIMDIRKEIMRGVIHYIIGIDKVD